MVHCKTYLVVGGASGIGAEISRLLSSRGHTVIITDKNGTALSKLVSNLSEQSNTPYEYELDVRSKEEVENVTKEIFDRGHIIDGVIYVAGVLRVGSVMTISDEDWTESFDVNVKGLFQVARATIPLFAKGGGSFVTIASNASKLPRMNMGAYSPSKAAATMVTKCLGLELASSKIRCNIIHPGSTKTNMLSQMQNHIGFYDELITGSLTDYKTGIPLKKIADARDIAGIVSFLLSDEANHITMQEICVDGGATLGV